MKYKTFSRSKRIKDIKREVRRIYKKTISDYRGIKKKKLLFRVKR